ncbi:unnamed protein product [Ixodes persulcatus]
MPPQTSLETALFFARTAQKAASAKMRAAQNVSPASGASLSRCSAVLVTNVTESQNMPAKRELLKAQCQESFSQRLMYLQPCPFKFFLFIIADVLYQRCVTFCFIMSFHPCYVHTCQTPAVLSNK